MHFHCILCALKWIHEGQAGIIIYSRGFAASWLQGISADIELHWTCDMRSSAGALIISQSLCGMNIVGEGKLDLWDMHYAGGQIGAGSEEVHCSLQLCFNNGHLVWTCSCMGL